MLAALKREFNPRLGLEFFQTAKNHFSDLDRPRGPDSLSDDLAGAATDNQQLPLFKRGMFFEFC
jgi:hypothetical protein